MRYVLLLILLGCGQVQTDHTYQSHNSDIKPGGPTDPDFETYTMDFEIRTGKDVSHIPVQYGDLDNNKVGVCHSWSNGQRKIRIDRKQWNNKLTQDQKDILIWHEFGHCALRFGHNDTLRPDNCPVHIMNWQIPQQPCIDRHYNNYYERFLEDM